MKATITTETKKYFHCPECGAQYKSDYNHILVGARFGSWYCGQCGRGMRGIVTEDGVEFTPSDARRTKTLVLLRLDADLKKPIHIVVEGMLFHKDGDDMVKLLADQQAKDKYFYNQHTCPSNYLGCRIKEGDDTDPHGLFVHQQTVLMPKNYNGTLDRVVEGGGRGRYPDVKVWTETFSSLRIQPAN